MVAAWGMIAVMVVLFLYLVVHPSAELLISMWTIALQVWTGRVAGKIRNWVWATLLPNALPPALRAAEAVQDLMEEASRCMLEECKLEQQCWQDILLGINSMRRHGVKMAMLEPLYAASCSHRHLIQALESKARLWRERLRYWLDRGCEAATLDVHILRYDSSIRRHSQNEYPTAADVGMDESTGATGADYPSKRPTDPDAIRIALLEAREVKDDVADATASPRGPPADEPLPSSPEPKCRPSPASPAPAPEASDRRRFRVTSHPKYRTVLCERYKKGACFRKNCAFAHGEEALRQPRFPQPPTDASPAAS
eukprot:TRINITY_DN368_c0_g1_i1.p1 TRINITY_DN368_c0_g1~~TRINITY_DN368_c0_g1_i1.p1  ORF type:complete len:311 (+),score=28.05 TRINITY_DN368_c0_g1_i1:78-1010(+)